MERKAQWIWKGSKGNRKESKVEEKSET